MSSNRVPAHHNQTKRVQTSLRPKSNQWTSIIPLLVLALGLGGCALNSIGLPGGLPVPPSGGGGSLTISRTTLVNGVQGRTYTIWIPTSGGSGTLLGCSIIAGTLPTGLSITQSNDAPTTAAVSFCKITGTITTAGPTSVNFTVQASDTATPANTASQAFSIFVRPEFAVTTATPFLNGVAGRTYGNPAELPVAKTPQPVATNVSATQGNQFLSQCDYTFAPSNPGFPATRSVAAATLAANSTSCPLNSGATTLGAAGPYTVTTAATDSDIMDTQLGQTTKIVVPKRPRSSAALGLTVNAALGVTLTQSTNATPTTALLNAVQGRSYGTGGQAAGAPSYAATGGLTTTGNYNWCISTGALPGGFVASPSALAACPTTAAVPVATAVTVTSAAAGAAGGPTTFTLLAGDTGNAAVSGVTTATTVGAVSNNAATNLTINAPLSLAVNFTSPLPDAVVGRTYGGAGFTSIIYTASLGVGAYTFTAPPTAAAPAAGVFPAPMSCVSAATTLTCSSAAITGTVGAYTNAPASVNDAGNAAVPGSASAAPVATATQTLTLNVRAALTFLSVNYANPLPAAVDTRSWGTGVGFTPLIYTAQNGLGGYSFAISGTAFPTGIACATAAATFTCDTTTAGSVTGAAGPYNGILVNANDTANVTTPSASASATQPPAQSRDLTVNADISLASVVPDPGIAATAAAVVGRTYGKAPQAPPLYTFAGGLGGYTITTPAIPAWMTCTPGATTLTCASTGAGTVAAGASTITANVVDTANAATPAKSPAFADSRTITVNTALALVASFNDPMPDAVRGRTYGGLGFTSPVYTASNGLGSYVFTLPGNAGAPGAGLFPAPMACVAGVTTATCSSGVITATAGNYTTVPVSANDAANLTTPGSASAGVTATVNRTLTVRAEFTITTVTAFLPGVDQRTYGNPAAPDLRTPQPVNTDVSATVGNAPLTSCTFTVTAVNPGFNLTPAPVGTTCPLSSGTTTLTPAGVYSVSVSISDTAITDPVSSGTVVPAGTVNNSGAPLGLTVNAQLSVALNATSPNPALASAQAVLGRTYGIAPKAPVVYDVTGGLPAAAAPLYAITSSGTLITDTNIGCPGGSTSATCSSAVGVTKGTPGTGATLTVSATDTANSATPSGAASTPIQAFTIQPALAIGLAQNSVNLTGGAPAVLDPGVTGRTYARGGQLATGAVNYTAGGTGTGSYRWCISSGAVPGGFVDRTVGAVSTACALGTSTAAANITLEANPVSGGASTYNFTMQLDDGGNSTTPDSFTAATSSPQATRVVIGAAITLTGVLPDPGNAATSTAVIGRQYGAPGGRTSPLYTFAGGLPGGYTISTPAIPTWMTCTPSPAAPNSTTLSCDSGVTTVSGASSPITVDVVDAANAATPAGSLTPGADTRTVTVVAAITLTGVVPDPGAATSTAVVGRTYGKAPKAPPVYTFGGGLPGGYTISTTAKPAWMTCTPSPAAPNSTTLSCDSGATTVVAGPSTITVNVVDTQNSTTPAGSLTPGPDSRAITVNAALAIALAQNTVNLTGGAPAVLLQGVTGRTYARGALATTGAVNYTTGGTGSGTYRWCISSGAVPGGFVDRALAAAVSTTCGLGTSTAATNITLEANPVSGGAATYNFTMRLDDDGNNTTPDSFAAATSSPQATRVVIGADISLTTVTPDPGDAATSTAVEGRTYGKPSPQVPPVYTFGGGLPGGYTISTPAIPGWMTCTPSPAAPNSTTLTCDSGAGVVAPGASTITANVVDTANAATPARSPAFADSRTITVVAEISLTSVVPNPGAATSAAVIGRKYGAPGGRTSPLYTFGGGLPGGYTISTTAKPAWMTCTPSPLAPNSTTLTCESTGVGTVTAGPSTITVNAVDTQNSTTPAGSLTPGPDSRTITVKVALAITPVTLPNGLKGFTYVPAPFGAPGGTLFASGGLGGNTWVADGSSGPCTAIGSLPSGLSLTPTSPPGDDIVLSGTPTVASTLTSQFTFEVCVFDTQNSTTPRGTPAVLPTYTVNIMNTFAYVAGAGSDTVEVINTTSNAWVASIPDGGSGEIPMGVAISPDGRKAYVTLTANSAGADEVLVIDTITNAVTTTITFATCNGPQGVAMGSPGGVPTAFVACSNGIVEVIDVGTDTVVPGGELTTLGSGGNFYGIALTPDELYVYVTDATNNEVVIFDAGSPFAELPALGSPFAVGVTAPHGIAFNGNAASSNHAYIAGSTSNNVVVIDTSTTPVTVLAGTPISTGVDSAPESIAVTPNGARFFVTLAGAPLGVPVDQFAVFDDGAPPTYRGAFTSGAGTLPFGVTIPPLLVVPGTGLRVYITPTLLDDVLIFNDNLGASFPANGGSPITGLSAGSASRGIAHIPVPR